MRQGQSQAARSEQVSRPQLIQSMLDAMRIPDLRGKILFALAMLCLGNVVFADDLSDDMSAEVITVNVNEADAASIANTLIGIGYSRAQAIVDYREKHGRFYSAEELTAVKGIGQSTVQKNLMRITTK